jgi:hypothetical protein
MIASSASGSQKPLLVRKRSRSIQTFLVALAALSVASQREGMAP